MRPEEWNFIASILLGLTSAAAYEPILGMVDKINRRYLRNLTERASQLGIRQDTVEILMRLWWLATMAIGAIVGIVMGMVPVAVVLCLLAVSFPRTLMGLITERRRVLLRDQMVSTARLLAAQYRAGLSDTEAIRAVAHEAPMPLGSDLRRCVAQFDAGATVRDALVAMKEQLQIQAVTLFVVTLLTCKESGGKVTEAMENISASLQELQRVERKRESDTAGGRTLVLVLAAFPVTISLVLWAIDPISMSLVFSTLPGQFVLSAVILMTYASIRWAYWLVSALE